MSDGYWKLNIEMFKDGQEASEATLDHIGEQIKKGFTEGQVVEEDEEDDIETYFDGVGKGYEQV